MKVLNLVYLLILAFVLSPFQTDAHTCSDIFNEPRRHTLAGKDVLSFEKRELVRDNVILDTNLAGAPLTKLLASYRETNPYREVFMRLNRLRGPDEPDVGERIVTDRAFAERLLRENKISYDDYDIVSMHYRVLFGTSLDYWSYIDAFHSDYLQKRRNVKKGNDLQVIFPERVLSEYFGTEYSMVEDKLYWVGPKDILKRALDIPQIREDLLEGIHQLNVTVSRESPEYQSVLKKLAQVDLGGKNGENDRRIVADIFFAQRATDATPLFATADKGILRGLLRLKYHYTYADQLVRMFRDEKLEKLKEVVEFADELPIIPKFGAWRTNPEKWPMARAIFIPDIEVTDSTNTVRKLDLLYFTRVNDN